MLILTCLSRVATFLLLEYVQESLCPLILLELKHFGERHVHMVRHTIFPRIINIELSPGNQQLSLLFFVHREVFLFEVHVSVKITFKVCIGLSQILIVDEDWSCQLMLLLVHTLVSHGTANHLDSALNLESSFLLHRLIHGLNINDGWLLSWTQVVEDLF